jgi:hypothetical protein
LNYPNDDKGHRILVEGRMRHEGKVIIRVIGPLRLIGRDGSDKTPRGRKACALLALLALAPNYQRARQWLQDKLWSDRGNQQGSDSLRQTLAEIRRALGPERDCLISDRCMIALDRNQVYVDETPSGAGVGNEAFADESILLEGLDVRDIEFENWLRDQRLHFEKFNNTNLRSDAVPSGSRSAESQPHRLHLVLERPDRMQSAQETILADALMDIIAKTISEIGSIDVIDRRASVLEEGRLDAKPPSALSLRASVVHDNEAATWRILLSEAAGNRVIWATTDRQRPAAAFNTDAPNVLGQLNLIVDVAMSGFASAFSTEAQRRIATFLCREGIRHLFRLGAENFTVADKLFARAFELEPRGVYLAWRAYLRTFLLVERHYTCRQTLIEEALEFMHRALEMEPHNSYVASFSATVHTIIRQSYVAAYELAQRALHLNRSNPLGWACLGVAECHLGKTRSGFKHTLMAREIAGATPFRYPIEAMSAAAGLMAGDFEQAIWCGEASHGLSPGFAPPLRYLSALYLFRGQHELSLHMVHKLRALEPDFCYEMLRDKSYPVASLHRTKLLELLPRREI